MSDTLRVTPTQARSQKRLESLRQAAREVIAEQGRDRFTTNQIALRAGCSIGTFYRYFPDRVAVLDDLFPTREMVLREPSEAGPNAEVLNSAAVEAHAILTDASLSNPRDRVRGARDVLAAALGIEQ